MESDFLAAIDCLLRFRDKTIEAQYENYKQKTLSTNFKIFFILFMIGGVPFYIIQIVQFYLSVKGDDPFYSFKVELVNFLTFSIAVIIEIIIFCITSLYFLRGVFFNFAILVILTEISVGYFPKNLVYSQFSLTLMVQMFSISSFYTKSWIVSSISLILGTVYSSFRMAFGASYILIQIIAFPLENLYMLILYIFIFYKQDETNRRDFYNLIQTKKKKGFLRKLLREIPVPILHIKASKPIFINDPFQQMFNLKNKNINLSLNKVKLKGIEPKKILDRLSKLKTSISNQCFADILNSETISNPLDSEIFHLSLKDKKSRIQVKRIEISLGNSNTTIYIFTNIDEITEEKKIQKQYQKILISSFSHDIRTPINGIEGIISNLLNLNFSLKISKKFNIILSLTKKLLYYIDILHDFSQLETNSFLPSISKFSLISPITEVFKIFAREFLKKKLETSLINSNCSCQIANDIRRIKEIGFILIGNALKYTLTGKFSISIHHEHSDNHY